MPVDQLGKARGALPDSGACESNPAFQPSGPGARPLDGFALGDFDLRDAGAAQPWAQAVRLAWDFLTTAPIEHGATSTPALDTPDALPRADTVSADTAFAMPFENGTYD